MSSNPPQPVDPNVAPQQPVGSLPFYPAQNEPQSYAQQPYGQPAYGQQPYRHPAYGQPAYGQPAYYPPYPPGYGEPAQTGSSGLSIAALVTGILGFVLSWFPLLGVVLAALGIIFGAIGLQRGRTQGRGMALAGLILGILGAVLFVVFVSAWW